MRLIKMTGGLGNQMFIYAFYLKMKQRFANTRIDLSDMMHYHVHHGYEMNRVFALPQVEFCMNRTWKKVLEFLFFKTILERKQKSLDAFWKPYAWPFIYFKGFYQSERFFSDIEQEVRKAFAFDMSKASDRSVQMAARMDNDVILYRFMCAVEIIWSRSTGRIRGVFASFRITGMQLPK